MPNRAVPNRAAPNRAVPTAVPLRVRPVLRDVLRLVVRHPWLLVGLTLPVQIASFVIFSLAAGAATLAGSGSDDAVVFFGYDVIFLVALVLAGTVVSVLFALPQILAYDAWQGRRIAFGARARDVARCVPALLLLAAPFVFVFEIGLGLFVLPALVISAMWGLYQLAVLEEGQGLRGLSRSYALARPYLAPLTFMWSLIFACWFILPSLVWSVLSGEPSFMVTGTLWDLAAGLLWPQTLLQFGCDLLSNTLHTALAAVLFSRLTRLEAHEDDVADVFD